MNFESKILSLWNLPLSKISVKLRPNFRNRIFLETIKNSNINNLCKKLNLSYRTFRNYNIGKTFIPLNIMEKIFVIINKNKIKKLRKQLESNISFIKYKQSKNYYEEFMLPFDYNIHLSKIAGHLCGDGGITKKNGLVSCFYSNKNIELINLFNWHLNKIFKKAHTHIVRYNGAYLLQCDSLIKVILLEIFGNMSHKNKAVPSFVLNGRDEFKTIFVQALFDDEANVREKEHKIDIKMANKPIIKNVKKMLEDLGIKTNGIYKRIYPTQNQFRLIISNRKNIINFYRLIGFTHSQKKKLLSNSIQNYKFTHYSRKDFKNIVLDILKSNKELKMAEIAKLIGRKPHSQINSLLRNLVNRGLLKIKTGYKGGKIYSIEK